MTISDRIIMLQQKMKELALDAYYIPTSDPHQCEYLAEHDKIRVFMSGFTGSAGTLLVTRTGACLWTDGRYFLQAEQELAGTGIVLQKMGEPNVPTLYEYLAQQFPGKSRIGMDGKVVSVESFTAFIRELPEAEFVIDNDLAGQLWENRPKPVLSTAFILGIEYAGQSVQEKLRIVREHLAEQQADTTVIGALEDICYLYNIRGRDIESTPVVTAYTLVHTNYARLYIDERQLTPEVRTHLEQAGVTIAGYSDIFADAAQLTGTVYLDPSRTNIFVRNCIHTTVIEGLNITSRMKAVKNSVEIENFRHTFVKDGVAMVKILKWVEDNAHAGITEWDVSEKLLHFRAEQDAFIEESFSTIAGYGSNGAIIHYAPQKDSAAVLAPRGFLLLDSGGQYMGGTTDITRTIPLGMLTEEEKIDYTLVLKSHIQLALAVFPENTLGYKLDTIARMPLWKHKKDYKHGTGHGVGYVLSVHEGPQTIGLKYAGLPLCSGMITSNEPGIYCAGSHGIRIENLTLTKKAGDTPFGSFLTFETLTLCPIDTRPVIKDMLSQEELVWLNTYHETVYQALAPLLDSGHRSFLQKRTAAI
ncbi:MAG: aminopeptidase P family protein [Treponema sp.]